MPKSKELEAVIPSERAIVRQYVDVIAKSPTDIKHGEAVVVAKDGTVYGRERFRRRVLGYQIGMFSAVLGGGVLALSGAWLPGIALYLGGVSPMLWHKYRGTGTLMAIDVIVRQGHLEEGQRRFDAVPQLRRRNPASYAWLAGNLASHRGEYATALTWWREAFPRTTGLLREMVKLGIAKALVLSGKNVEATREFEDVRFPPGADDVLTGLTLGRVMLVLHDALPWPSDDELHEWARKALEYSHTGVLLAAIGWAFERSGDEEMAGLLASEAGDRMHYPYLATWWPALQQWLDRRAVKSDEPEPSPTEES